MDDVTPRIMLPSVAARVCQNCNKLCYCATKYISGYALYGTDRTVVYGVRFCRITPTGFNCYNAYIHKHGAYPWCGEGRLRRFVDEGTAPG